MEAYQTQTQLFKVLMHPTRLAILEILRGGEQCVCHMEAVFGLRQAHISQHLMVMREAGLVSDRRDGWNIFYRVIRPDIYPVLDAAHAFSGAALGEGAVTPAKTGQDCPCPKCSTNQTAERGAVALLAPAKAGR